MVHTRISDIYGGKGRDMTQAYDETPLNDRQFILKVTKRRKMFDYKTITDQLRMVS